MKIDKFNEGLQASSESVTRSTKSARKQSDVVKSYRVPSSAMTKPEEEQGRRLNSPSGNGESSEKLTKHPAKVTPRDCAPFTPNWKHGSFSFLNLLDHSFPYRSQSITPSRKNSSQASLSSSSTSSSTTFSHSSSTRTKSSSLECLSRTKFLARSNPIGLVEPSAKKDGYAVGRDGSCYRSTEHIFVAETLPLKSRDRSSPASNSSSFSGSTSSINGMGIRVGSGIIATGKPVPWANTFMPFGFVSKAKSPSVATARISDASSFIQQGIKEIESLTRAAHSTTIEETSTITRTSTTITQVRTQKQTAAASVDTSSSRQDNDSDADDARNAKANAKLSDKKKAIVLASPFAAVDVMLKSCLDEEPPVQFTIKRGKNRSQSLSRTTMTLPEQDVTISLPASRRTSRDPSRDTSVDRECSSNSSSVSAVVGGGKRKQLLLSQSQKKKSNSIEVFNGTYDMKVPNPKRKISVDVIEVETTFVAYSAEVAEEVEKMSKLLDGEIGDTLRVDDLRQCISAEEKSEENADTVESSPQELLLSSMTHLSSAVKDAPNDAAATADLSPPSSGSGSNLGSDDVACQESVPEINPSCCNSRENPTMKADQKKQGQQNNDVVDDSSKGKSDINHHGGVVGETLKGLTVALESLQQQQYEQKSKLLQQQFPAPAAATSSSSPPSSGETSSTFTATSGRSSRACSPGNSSSRGSSSGFRSRRNSLDLYTADVNIKMRGSGSSKKTSVEIVSDRHITCDETTIGNFKLCGRCHSPDHITNSCKEYDDLLCPRCLEWDHWEDTCPRLLDCSVTCEECGNQGHSAKVHEVSQFPQRRAVVDHVGWQHFQHWFYENCFRSWWQLNGCVGVPLYKIYQRNSEWRMEIAPLDESYLNDEEQHGLLCRQELPQRPLRRRNYRLEKDDSIEELMKKINAPRKRVSAEDAEAAADSGRSTPEHLKGYGSSLKEEEDKENDNNNVAKTRVRTYSETLKMLDADILAELKI